jgi:sulfonate transport system permease protein
MDYIDINTADESQETVVKPGKTTSISVGRVGGYFILPLAVPLLLIVVWELFSKNGFIRPTILPPPSNIWLVLVDMTTSGELPKHLLVSLVRVIKGFSAGAILGLVAGVLIGLSPRVERALVLITGLLRPIPIIAWVPVLILWMGIDEASKITVIAIGSFWPVLLNVVHGIRNTDKKYVEVATILEKSRWTLLTKVVLPSALPSIFTGIRIGIGIAWMSVVGAELIAASSGVGYMIMYARELSQADVMLVGVISIGITGLLIDFIIRTLETRLLKWNV